MKERDLRGAGRALLRAVSSELSDEEDEDEDEDEASACFEGRLLSRFRRAGFLSYTRRNGLDPVFLST